MIYHSGEQNCYTDTWLLESIIYLPGDRILYLHLKSKMNPKLKNRWVACPNWLTGLVIILGKRQTFNLARAENRKVM